MELSSPLALKVNQVLQILKLNKNTIDADGALLLLSAIHSSTCSEIVHLDLQHIPVTHSFASLYLNTLTYRPELTVTHGGYLTSRKVISPADLW